MEQHQSIILFPNGAPGEPNKLKEEESEKLLGIKIAGTRVLGVSNVSEPTITFYPARKENNLGTTIIVVPGGGYNVLAYNLKEQKCASDLIDMVLTVCCSSISCASSR